MRTSGTFTVASFEPADYTSPVTTGVPVGHAHMVKEFTGGIAGQLVHAVQLRVRSSLGHGHLRRAFAHSATTDGRSPERLAELLVIAPGSGSDGLAGITGTGRIVIDDQGTHTVRLDYELGS
jgi:Protein of unknown function (DUF3224)